MRCDNGLDGQRGLCAIDGSEKRSRTDLCLEIIDDGKGCGGSAAWGTRLAGTAERRRLHCGAEHRLKASSQTWTGTERPHPLAVA